MIQSLGKTIRYFRVKSNMTQAYLANGIISESYLSKIENDRVDPPNETFLLLCQKLGIDPSSRESEDLIRNCYTWFNNLFDRNIEEVTRFYKDVIEHNDKILNTPLFLLVEIHKIRYFTIMNKNKKAKKQINYLNSIKKEFNDKQNYYWLKYSGDYYFTILSYNKSLELYQSAEDYLKSVEKKDKYALYYMIALSSSKLRQTSLSLKYSNKALNYYQKKYNLKRCAECHILLGISHQRRSEFNESMDNYKTASNIGRKIEDFNILVISKQNLGKLYSVLGKPEKAITFYLKSYHARKDSSINMRVVPISSLMKEYYDSGDILNATKWMEKGKSLSKGLAPLESKYVYEFAVYYHLINNNSSALLTKINEKVIPFLTKSNLRFEKYYYLKVLGNYYNRQRKYKLSAEYYKRSNRALHEAYKLK